MISAFSTSGYLMQSVVEEKESRMVEVLLSSMRPRDLLAGKFIALSILGMAQMLLWAGTVVFIVSQITTILPTVVGLNITALQLAVLLVYFILGYLLFGSAYAALGALATNMREGPQLAVFITLPAVVPLYALTLISGAPNGPVAVVLSIFPLTAPLTMVMRAALVEVPTSELLISVALLSLTIALIIWLAGRLFRVNTLLAGQMPKFRDILRLVRESV
jgi:ABC-2 type transport system permease protein